MSTFVYTQTSVFIAHLLAHIHVIVGIVLDLTMTFLVCPYPTKSNKESTLTHSPPVEKFLTIVFLKQFQLPNFYALFSLTHHSLLPGNSQYIAPSYFPF